VEGCWTCSCWTLSGRVYEWKVVGRVVAGRCQVEYEWKVVGRVVAGRCQVEYMSGRLLDV